MKLPQSLLVGLMAVFASSSSCGDDGILPWDAVAGEKQFRAAIEERFPELSFGFYHWNGDWIIGALEDFDHHRILLLQPGEGVGDMQILRNGEELPLPPGEPVSVRIAGALHTLDGTVSSPEHAYDHRIGYWIALEATDELSLSAKLTWPCEGQFHATYDPDAQWTISFRWAEAEQDRKEPADAYEISRRSLLKRVMEVLAERKECTVRLKRGDDVVVTTFSEARDAGIQPIHVALSDKIAVGREGVLEERSPRELEQDLEAYRAAAQAADARPQVVIQVAPDADDELFRATLMALAEEHFVRVDLIRGQADDDRQGVRQDGADQPAAAPESEAEGGQKPKPESAGRSE